MKPTRHVIAAVLTLFLCHTISAETRRFDTRMDFLVGDDPLSHVVRDLNGDGILNLALANASGGDISVLLGNGDGTFDFFGSFGKRLSPSQMVAGDLDGDSIPDLSICSGFGFIFILLGTGDGSFTAAEHFGFGVGSQLSSMAIHDVDRDGDRDLIITSSDADHFSVLRNNSTSLGTVSAELTCSPSAGTLPFTTQMLVGLTNRYPDQSRRMAANIDVTLAGGSVITNWRNGYLNIAGNTTFQTSWNQYLPALPSLIGDNTFTLAAQDVTPSPYNQPPYPVSGDTASSVRTVTAEAP